jgi:cytoskeleton protein RodZ
MSDTTASTASGQTGDDAGAAVGRRLREARTQQKLTLERVAKELHLDVSVISAIEDDNREGMPAPIFVQGYIRSYARLLELPEDELVRQYVAQASEPPPLSVIRVDSRRRMPFLQLPSMRLLRNLILLMLAAILLWLAWPVAERLLESRPAGTEQPQAGRLELPPAE